MFVALLVVALPAVPLNLAPVGAEPAPNAVLEVRDYTIGYGEDVPDGYAAVASAPFVGGYPTVNRSGVIVVSEQRRAWMQTVGAAQLRNRGRTSFDVGGLSWRETVTANWTGWNVRGNGSAYKVFLRRSGGPWLQSFASDPSRSDAVVAGRTVAVGPAERGFEVVVAGENRTLDAARVPANGTRQYVGGLTIARNETVLFAESNETRVPVAKRQHATGRDR